MAQQQENKAAVKWEPGQKCKIFNHSRKRWVEGRIFEVFEEDGEKYVNVKYGKGLEISLPIIRIYEILK